MPCFPLEDILRLTRAQTQVVSALEYGARRSTPRARVETKALEVDAQRARHRLSAPLVPQPADAAVAPPHEVARVNQDPKPIDAPQRPLTDVDKAIRLHLRMAHTDMRRLVEGYFRRRYTGYTLPRQMLGQRSLAKLHKCDDCGMCKQHHHKYHRQVPPLAWTYTSSSTARRTMALRTKPTLLTPSLRRHFHTA